MDSSFYSDRENGPVPRTIDEVTANAWKGVVALYYNLLERNYLAHAYPHSCGQVGGGVVGTARTVLVSDIESLIPSLHFPLLAEVVPPTHVALDLIDFLASNVAEPREGDYHHFYDHGHLAFDVDSGREYLRRRVDEVFARNGVAFTLSEEMRVRRLLPPHTGQIVRTLLRPSTGDAALDQLLESAGLRFLSPDDTDHRDALEKLWDAFERTKSLEDPNNKRVSVQRLLDLSATGRIREELESEAASLTAIGNTFRIRHHEAGQSDLADPALIDWLFVRAAALILLLLKKSGRG